MKINEMLAFILEENIETALKGSAKKSDDACNALLDDAPLIQALSLASIALSLANGSTKDVASMAETKASKAKSEGKSSAKSDPAKDDKGGKNTKEDPIFKIKNKKVVLANEKALTKDQLEDAKFILDIIAEVPDVTITTLSNDVKEFSDKAYDSIEDITASNLCAFADFMSDAYPSDDDDDDDDDDKDKDDDDDDDDDDKDNDDDDDDDAPLFSIVKKKVKYSGTNKKTKTAVNEINDYFSTSGYDAKEVKNFIVKMFKKKDKTIENLTESQFNKFVDQFVPEDED